MTNTYLPRAAGVIRGHLQLAHLVLVEARVAGGNVVSVEGLSLLLHLVWRQVVDLGDHQGLIEGWLSAEGASKIVEALLPGDLWGLVWSHLVEVLGPVGLGVGPWAAFIAVS